MDKTLQNNYSTMVNDCYEKNNVYLLKYYLTTVIFVY